MRPTPLIFLALAACGGSEPPGDSGSAIDPVQVLVRMTNVSPAPQTTSTGETFEVMFAPGVLIVHDASFALYEPGMPILFPGMEALAEDGNNAPLIDQIEGLPGALL